MYSIFRTNVGGVFLERVIIGSYEELAEFTDTCIPTLRKLVNRRQNPLPCVRVSPRKIVFVREQVIDWFKAEASRQSSNDY